MPGVVVVNMAESYHDDRGWLFEAFARNSLDHFVTEK